MQMHNLKNDSPEATPVNHSTNVQLEISSAPSLISHQSSSIDQTAILNSEGEDSLEDSVTISADMNDNGTDSIIRSMNRRKAAITQQERTYPSNFFEGAEKRIAVFLSPTPNADLRKISR